MFFKVAAFLTLQFLVDVYGTRENVVINLPKFDDDQLNWPEQKLETIKYLLKTLNEVGNVTLVGWQRIYNADGTLKEIRTIELTILTSNPHWQQAVNLEYMKSYMESYALQDTKDAFKSTGISLSGSIHLWNRNGDLRNLIETESDSVKLYDNEYRTLDWRQKVTGISQESIQNLIEDLERHSSLPVAIYRWDVNGTFIVSSSKIVPEASLIILEAENANVTVLDSAIRAVSRGFFIYNEKLLRHVSDHMVEEFPDYSWIVVDEDFVKGWCKTTKCIENLCRLIIPFDKYELMKTPTSIFKDTTERIENDNENGKCHIVKVYGVHHWCIYEVP